MNPNKATLANGVKLNATRTVLDSIRIERE